MEVNVSLKTNKKSDIINSIKRLKKEKNAILLSHYYQIEPIQEIADYVGDSLGLAQKTINCNEQIIVFCGVNFMAETTKILNPKKKVILPDINAGCSLSDSCPADKFREFKSKHPDHIVVTYINTSAEIKTLSDIIVTSSNAEKIINSLPKNQKIIFTPDKNLGTYLNKKTNRNMLLWEGTCMVHEAFSLGKLQKLILKHPEAKIISHPESDISILNASDFIGSTSAMINYVKKDNSKKYIVATEKGIFYKMRKETPNKTFIQAPTKTSHECSCGNCYYMKMNTLEKLHDCLLYEKPEIILSKDIINRALPPINRMLELS